MKFTLNTLYVFIVTLTIVTIGFFIVILFGTFFDSCNTNLPKGAISYCNLVQLRQNLLIVFVPILIIEGILIFVLRKFKKS